MSVLDIIGKEDLKDVLGKGWMTHDGMWFFHVQNELGMDAANRLNRAAISSLAQFEVPRMKAALGMENCTFSKLDDVKTFMEGAMALVMPPFMKFTYSFTPPDTFSYEWEKDQCFAFKGVRRIGKISEYRCGVMYRIDRWLDALGLSYEGPQVEECRMHTLGRCKGEYKFRLPGGEK
ncbi:MAG: DUF6125 family protein [Thermodesulfobacteriota bacterium]